MSITYNKIKWNIETSYTKRLKLLIWEWLIFFNYLVVFIIKFDRYLNQNPTKLFSNKIRL